MSTSVSSSTSANASANSNASALCGQTALIALPALSADQRAINSYSLPVQLTIGKKNGGSGVGKKRDSASASVTSSPSATSTSPSSAIGNGMDVIKIGENGKGQGRRIGISRDGCVLLVSSKKGGGMRSLFRNEVLFRKRRVRSGELKYHPLTVLFEVN